MTRRGRPLPGPRCGWPDECSAKGIDHSPEPGTRRAWTFHDVQCQVPNPAAGPHLDGYPECSQTDGHAGDHDYCRHVAEKAASLAVIPPGAEPELEIR